jgi:DNA repair exonuclease SbcCD nuclease subunit
MSELAIVTSDIHVHKYQKFNQDNRRLNNGIAYLDYLFNFASVNEIKYILLPGDLYNLMQIMSTEAEDAIIACFKNNFKKYPLIKIIAISGNHDQASKNLIDQPATSALQHLAILFDNFILLNDMSRLSTDNNNHIFGISYFEYPEHFKKVLGGLQDKVKQTYTTGKSYLLMHQMVASGFPEKDHIQPDDSLFDNFDMVFNGHVHDGGEITDKFINVGSPMHRDLGDLGKRKGFWILDLDDPNTISFKDITDKFPQFIRKEEGSELTEWEQQQYVVWSPVINTKTTKQQEMLNNFRTDLAPETIIKNYAEVTKLDEKVLNYGLILIK